MLEEILSWLPVKSLARFKCVKNSWSTATFFQNPSFIAKHQRHRSQTNPDLVVVNLDSEPWVWALSLHTLILKMLILIKEYACSVDMQEITGVGRVAELHRMDMFACINGIICVGGYFYSGFSGFCRI